MLNREGIRDVAEIIERELGLHYPTLRFDDLNRALQRAAEIIPDNNITTDSLINKILTEGRIPARYYGYLSSALTINETYFFREGPAIDFIRETVISEIINFNGNYKIWSAGCSSGEEPYTVAMILRENLPSSIYNNAVIYASDISETALKKASEGLYTNWSFRETPEYIKKKYFKKEKNFWRISPEVQKMVRFININLVSRNYGIITNDLDKFNLILCRNVLMYFEPNHIKKIASRFHDNLKENGWLITGQVELNDFYFSKFVKQEVNGGFFYRKGIKTAPQKKTGQPFKEVTFKPKQATIKKVPLSIIKEKTPLPIVSDYDKAKALADSGLLEESAATLEKIIDKGEYSTDIYYLYGTIQKELSNFMKSSEAFKKCIYINHEHIYSHIMLGELSLENNKEDSAAKYFKTALTLLSDRDPQEVVPDSGGLTAVNVSEMLKSLINLKLSK